MVDRTALSGCASVRPVSDSRRQPSRRGRLEVGPEVVDVLDADGHPHQRVGDRGGLGLPAAAPLERRLHAAERRRVHPQPGASGSAGRRPARPRRARRRRCRRSPGSGPPRWPGARASRRPAPVALAWARSTRRWRVRRPRSASHASNGPGDRAEQVAAALQDVVQLVVAGDDRAHHHVAVAGEVLASPSGRRCRRQSSSGRWSSGVAKVLSTTTEAPASCAAAAIVGMSAISSAGFVGDSSQTSAASSHASTTASVSVMSTSSALQPAAGLEVGQLHHAAVVGVPGRDHLRALADQVEHRARPRPARTRRPARARPRARRARPRRPSRSGWRSGRTRRSPPATYVDAIVIGAFSGASGSRPDGRP